MGNGKNFRKSTAPEATRGSSRAPSFFAEHELRPSTMSYGDGISLEMGSGEGDGRKIDL